MKSKNAKATNIRSSWICFFSDSIFLQEGYSDCELALRFGYPMRKRDKLLKRKFHLAWKDGKKQAETLREMEEMVKRRLFTEEELNSK